MTDRVRQRWAGELGCQPDDSPEAVRAAFFDHLEKNAFQPSEEATFAAARLTGWTLPEAHDSDSIRRNWEQDELNQLAEQFWELPPADRRLRWAELDPVITDQMLRSRYRKLEPGLDVAVVPHEDEAMQKLAVLYRQLFVASPREFSVRKWQWLVQQPQGTLPAQQIKRFETADPKLAALVPEMARVFERMTFSVNTAGEPSFVSVGPMGVMVPNADGYELRQRERMSEIDDREPKREEPVSSRSLFFVIAGVVITLNMIISIFRGSSSSSVPPPRIYNPVQSNQPKVVSREVQLRKQWDEALAKALKSLPEKKTRTFTEEEVNRFRKYRPKPEEPIPDEYMLWVLLGKPSGTLAKTEKK